MFRKIDGARAPGRWIGLKRVLAAAGFLALSSLTAGLANAQNNCASSGGQQEAPAPAKDGQLYFRANKIPCSPAGLAPLNPPKSPPPKRAANTPAPKPLTLPPLPRSAIPNPGGSNSGGAQSQSAAASPGAGAAETVLRQKLSPPDLQRVLDDVGLTAAANSKLGALGSNGNTFFDQQARMRELLVPVPASPSRGTPAFSGPPVSAGLAPSTVEQAEQTARERGNIPGGIVLDDAAPMGPIEALGYDARFNALVLNDSAVYFSPISPRSLAVMCRALMHSDQIGVSLGAVHIVYGDAPKDSDLIFDLKMADKFLGDIVFAGDDWTRGYRFAKNYKPKPYKKGWNGVVFFSFNGVEFGMSGNQIVPTHANLDVRLYPIREAGADKSHQPDYDAIKRGDFPGPFKDNIKHISSNIDYYRNEAIVNRTFLYAEVAALLRALRDQGFDLDGLSRQIDPGA